MRKLRSGSVRASVRVLCVPRVYYHGAPGAGADESLRGCANSSHERLRLAHLRAAGGEQKESRVKSMLGSMVLQVGLRRQLAALVVGAAAVAGCGQVALGQAAEALGDLPGEIRGAAQVGAAQQEAITKYIEDRIGGLTGPNDKIRETRAALLRQLSPGASVSFRLRYADALGKKLKPILQQPEAAKSELAQVNVLVIAGELATGDSVELINAGRKSQMASVRFQAAYASRQVFERAGASAGAGAAATIDPALLRSLLDGVAKSVAGETDALVVDAGFAALMSAVQVESIRNDAAVALANTVNAWAKAQAGTASDETIREGLTRTATDLRNYLSQQGKNMSGDAQKASAELGGSLIWHARRVVKAQGLELGDAGKDGRDSFAKLVSSAESLSLFAGTLLSPSFRPAQSGLADAIRAGTSQGDATFITSADALLATLTKPPFGVAATKFQE